METQSIPVISSASTADANQLDMVAEEFPTFDHRGIIVEPFEDETKRDSAFRDRLGKMMIEVMIEFYAWSTARPFQESDRFADTLEKEINSIRETELQQGRSSESTSSIFSIEKTRQRLADFINRIKMALAALTDI